MRTLGNLAAGFAMLSALHFAGRAAFKHFVLGTFGEVSREFVWMTPLGYLFLFTLVLLPLLMVRRFLSADAMWRCAVWVLAWLSLFDALLYFPEYSRLSTAVLSAGVATWLVRRTWRDAASWTRRARMTWRVLAASFLVLTVTSHAWRWASGRREIAALADATAGAPNVLLLVLDTVRASDLGLYGYPKPTSPSLDRFAQGGAVFDRAIATASWTLPSHASMFTGRYSANLPADYRVPLDARDRTLAEVLRARGYRTAGFTANHHYTSWESGLQRGFTEYSDYRNSFVQVLKSTGFGLSVLADQVFAGRTLRNKLGALRRGLPQGQLFVTPQPESHPVNADQLTDEFLAWRAKRSGDERPYFAFLNYYDAHDPYRPVEPYRTRFAGSNKDANPRDLYDAEIAYLDHALGRLFENLDRSGELSNTLVVIVGDHGEHFGERGMTGHFFSVYMPLLHVPLILRFDGKIPAGRRVEGAVSLRDLGATILDVAGVAPAGVFPGISRSGLWRGTATPGSAAVASYGLTSHDSLETLRLEVGIISIVDDQWQYVMTGRKLIEELFAYHADSSQSASLVGSDAGKAAMPELRNRLRRTLMEDRKDQAAARNRTP